MLRLYRLSHFKTSCGREGGREGEDKEGEERVSRLMTIWLLVPARHLNGLQCLGSDYVLCNSLAYSFSTTAAQALTVHASQPHVQGRGGVGIRTMKEPVN